MSNDNRNLFLTHANEPTKQHCEYDAQKRMIAVYTARADALDGEKCILTQYKYISEFSTSISDRKEGFGVWQAAWDW